MSKDKAYLRKILKKTLPVIREAGKIALSMAGKLNIRYKGKINPVTNADKKTEKFLTENLKKIGNFGFLCEENTVTEIAPVMWVIDPIDGTVNYSHGLHFWSVSVALVEKTKPILGVTFIPAMNEIFYAVKGEGAFLNGKRIRVSYAKNMERALITTGFPYYVWEKTGRVMRLFRKFLRASQGIRRPGSATIDMAYVACGRFDGFWEEGLYPWDVAAGKIIIEEAGGKVTDYAGKDILFDGKIKKDRTLLASNGLLHGQMLKLTGEKESKWNR